MQSRFHRNRMNETHMLKAIQNIWIFKMSHEPASDNVSTYRVYNICRSEILVDSSWVLTCLPSCIQDILGMFPVRWDRAWSYGLFKYDCQYRGYISSTFLKDSTIYFIRFLALWELMFFRSFSTPLTWILMSFICGWGLGPLFGIGVSVTGVNSFCFLSITTFLPVSLDERRGKYLSSCIYLYRFVDRTWG